MVSTDFFYYGRLRGFFERALSQCSALHFWLCISTPRVFVTPILDGADWGV